MICEQWLPLINYLADISVAIYPVSESLRGATKMDTKLVPDKKEKKQAMISPIYLNEDASSMPSTAFDNVHFETVRSIEFIEEIFSILRAAREEKYHPPPDQLQTLYQNIKILGDASLVYLGKLRQNALTAKDTLILQNLMTANSSLGGIAYSFQT